MTHHTPTPHVDTTRRHHTPTPHADTAHRNRTLTPHADTTRRHHTTHLVVDGVKLGEHDAVDEARVAHLRVVGQRLVHRDQLKHEQQQVRLVHRDQLKHQQHQVGLVHQDDLSGLTLLFFPLAGGSRDSFY